MFIVIQLLSTAQRDSFKFHVHIMQLDRNTLIACKINAFGASEVDWLTILRVILLDNSSSCTRARISLKKINIFLTKKKRF